MHIRVRSTVHRSRTANDEQRPFVVWAYENSRISRSLRRRRVFNPKVGRTASCHVGTWASVGILMGLYTRNIPIELRHRVHEKRRAVKTNNNDNSRGVNCSRKRTGPYSIITMVCGGFPVTITFSILQSHSTNSPMVIVGILIINDNV